jgi:hypothetical protein
MMATNGNSEPRKRGCSARLMRGCGWVVLAVVALVLSCYLIEVYRCSRYTPTGDALFDKYARAVIKRQAWRLFSVPIETKLSLLDASTLQDWEGEFGDDPRYWLLCYSCATDINPAQGTEFTEQGLSDKYYYLDQAIQRGCADVNVLYYAFCEQSDSWMMQAKQSYAESEQAVHWQKLAPYERHSRMQALFGDEILQWLDKMIEAAPDESYPYYRRAWHHFMNSDYDLAQKDLEAGNSAPVNCFPSLYPASLIRERATSAEGLAPSYVVNLIAYFYCGSGTLPEFRVYKGLVGESLGLSELTDDPHWCTALRDFIVRFSQLRPDQDLFPMVGSIMLMGQSKFFLVEQGERLDTEQRKDLFSLHTRIRDYYIKHTERSISGSDELMHYMSHFPGLSTVVLMPVFSQYTGRYYQHWWDYKYVEDIKANAEYASFLTEMSAFDYETFRWPESEEDT